MLPDEFGFFRKNMHKYTIGTPPFKTLINNIKGFGASFQKVRKTGKLWRRAPELPTLFMASFFFHLIRVILAQAWAISRSES
jgi:hypothetical protein